LMMLNQWICRQHHAASDDNTTLRATCCSQPHAAAQGSYREVAPGSACQVINMGNDRSHQGSTQPCAMQQAKVTPLLDAVCCKPTEQPMLLLGCNSSRRFNWAATACVPGALPTRAQ
jgi:hypothetical protein